MLLSLIWAKLHDTKIIKAWSILQIFGIYQKTIRIAFVLLEGDNTTHFYIAIGLLKSFLPSINNVPKFKYSRCFLIITTHSWYLIERKQRWPVFNNHSSCWPWFDMKINCISLWYFMTEHWWKNFMTNIYCFPVHPTYEYVFTTKF